MVMRSRFPYLEIPEMPFTDFVLVRAGELGDKPAFIVAPCHGCGADTANHAEPAGLKQPARHSSKRRVVIDDQHRPRRNDRQRGL